MIKYFASERVRASGTVEKVGSDVTNGLGKSLNAKTRCRKVLRSFAFRRRRTIRKLDFEVGTILETRKTLFSNHFGSDLWNSFGSCRRVDSFYVNSTSSGLPGWPQNVLARF